MILDSENVFSSEQDLAGISAATASTNYIDMTDDERQVGTGEPLLILANVQTALVGSGATITVSVQVASASSFAVPITVLTLPAIAAASAAGEKVTGILPPGAVSTLRYMRALITPGAAVTSGKLDIALVHDVDGHRQMDSGFAISGT